MTNATIEHSVLLDPRTAPRLCIIRKSGSGATVENGLYISSECGTPEEVRHSLAGSLTMHHDWCLEDGDTLKPAVEEADRPAEEARVIAELTADGTDPSEYELAWITPRALEGSELEPIQISA